MLAAIRKNSQHFTRNIILATPSRRKKISICRKIVLTFFLHLVAFGTIVGFCALGAQIFTELEYDYEVSQCVNVNAIREDTLDKVFKHAIALQKTPREFQVAANSLMEEYEYILLKKKVRGYRFGVYYDDCIEWTFEGSFFYSFLVAATVGYGEITPDTHTGRLVSIIYALIGIPLFIVYLGLTGSSLARNLQGIYLKACGCCRKDQESDRMSSRLNKRSDVDGAETLKMTEADVNVEAAAAAVSFSNTVDDYEDNGGAQGSGPQMLSDIDIEHRPYWCPIMFALLLLAAHAVAGTLLISHWESWSFFDSFYFIFLVLSTIGYGDFLPVEATIKQGAFVYIYFLTGYTIWAAVYILIYEVVQHKFREFGRRMGIK